MKKVLVFFFNIALIIPFLLFYRAGAMVAYHMVPVWFIMSVINTVIAKSKKEIVWYNLVMAITAGIGIYICFRLYFKYVCWDSLGEAVLIAEIFIMVILVAMYTVAECAIKRFDTNDCDLDEY